MVNKKKLIKKIAGKKNSVSFTPNNAYHIFSITTYTFYYLNDSKSSSKSFEKYTSLPFILCNKLFDPVIIPIYLCSLQQPQYEITFGATNLLSGRASNNAGAGRAVPQLLYST